MTDTARTRTPAEAGWYVPGPLDPEALAAALRAVYGVLRTSRGDDVFSALYDADRLAGTGMAMPELNQVARAALAAIVGIGALEVSEPARSLQLWQSKNADASLQWAFGEALAQVSGEDRAAVEKDRAVERGFAVRVAEKREDAA